MRFHRLHESLRALLVACVIANATSAFGGTPEAPLPRVSAGTLERLSHFPSKHIDARHVEVWLPPGYAARAAAGTRHAVLYMHDGQMLFDPSTTWNKKAWRVDEVAARLMAQGQVRNFIIVAPWNQSGKRHAEYFPQGFLPHIEPATREAFVARALGGQPRSDDYLRFLVQELKPYIDSHYATLSDRDNTFLMGSSMGGLISLYGLLEYPQVFGGAAALSTHWIGGYERRPEIPDGALAYLREKLPKPASVRIYMDRGTTELDALYDDAQAKVDALMNERGFAAPNFVTRVFEGTGHNENAWHERLEIPLLFLMSRTPADAP